MYQEIVICDNCEGEGILRDNLYRLNTNLKCNKCDGEGRLMKFNYINYFKMSERSFIQKIENAIYSINKKIYKF